MVYLCLNIFYNCAWPPNLSINSSNHVYMCHFTPGYFSYKRDKREREVQLSQGRGDEGSKEEEELRGRGSLATIDSRFAYFRSIFRATVCCTGTLFSHHNILVCYICCISICIHLLLNILCYAARFASAPSRQGLITPPPPRR